MAIKPSAMAMLKKKVVEENREGSVGSKQTEKKETQSWWVGRQPQDSEFRKQLASS